MQSYWPSRNSKSYQLYHDCQVSLAARCQFTALVGIINAFYSIRRNYKCLNDQPCYQNISSSLHHVRYVGRYVFSTTYPLFRIARPQRAKIPFIARKRRKTHAIIYIYKKKTNAASKPCPSESLPSAFPSHHPLRLSLSLPLPPAFQFRSCHSLSVLSLSRSLSSLFFPYAFWGSALGFFCLLPYPSGLL